MGPHLHFQLSDGPDPTDSEGLPYGFDSYETIGKESLAQLKQQNFAPEPGATWQIRRSEMPVEGAVIRFRAR